MTSGIILNLNASFTCCKFVFQYLKYANLQTCYMNPAKVVKQIPEDVKSIIVTPFQRFVQLKAASGLVLIICAAIGLIWANSPWAESYFHLWETHLDIFVGDFGLSKTLHHWINDGLMAIFFFYVGLEIKKELLAGELSLLRQAAFPFFAAIGGMLVPAGIYILLNQGGPGAEGWGIPMATDIAFSLGILALLGDRVPISLKVFLTAFAIVDDLGAVLVIALFYSNEVQLNALLIVGALLLLLLLFNAFDVRRSAPYWIVGLVIWYFVSKSGIHATVAGILVALTIPANNRLRLNVFVENLRDAIDEFWDNTANSKKQILKRSQLSAIDTMEDNIDLVQPPLQRIEHSLGGFVSFFVMPVFAFANSGIALNNPGETLFSAIALHIVAGLVVGKTVGITFFSWLGVKLGWADYPEGVNIRQIAAVSMLGGVGFTMALFIANLAFDDAAFLAQAKAGVLLGSLLAGILGYLFLRRLLDEPAQVEQEQTEEVPVSEA